MIALQLHNELLSLVAVAGAVLLTGLVLRNPLGPQCLQTDFAALTAGLTLTAAILVVVVYAHQGFVVAGLNPIAAGAAVVGVLALSLVLFWKAFRIGNGLARADSGRSPFERIRRAAEPQPIPNLLASDQPALR